MALNLNTARAPRRTTAEMQTALDEQVVCSQGWTHKQLHDAFKFVQPPGNWKYPINKTLYQPTDEEVEMIVESIRYIAGGGAIVGRSDNITLIKAPGYYNTIGA